MNKIIDTKNILVTGGAGYIGSHICKALKLSGYNPITLDNLSHGHINAVRWGALEIGDIKDEIWLRSIIQRYIPSAIIHCSGSISVDESTRHPGIYYDNNVSATIALLNAMVKEQVRQIVFSSSCAVHGHINGALINEDDVCAPTTPYGRSKWIVEQILPDYARAYNLSYVSLRYFNAAGADPDREIGELHEPETHVIPLAIKAAIQGTPFTIYGMDYPTPDGTAIRDYIHVTDLAQAHLQALRYLEKEQNNCIINVGTGKGTSVRTLIDIIQHVTNKTISIKEADRRQGDVAELVANPERSQKLLKFSPSYSDIKTIIETAWQWHKSNNFL
jgi:UDP-glucose-4-epimerase GalE